MKNLKYLLLILLLSGCYTSSVVYRMEPSEDEQTFYEQGRPFAYKNIDSVIVSVGFDGYFDNEYILDVTIDNRTTDTFTFDPSNIYLFRFSSDTSMAEQKIYFAINPDKKIDSIQKTVVNEEKSIKRSAIASVLLAAAYLTTEVVAANNDIPYKTMDAIRATHEVTQIALDQSRIASAENIDNLYYSQDYWSNVPLRKTSIKADTFYTGKIHFNVPYSPFYKLYIPADNHIYHYTFKGTNSTSGQ